MRRRWLTRASIAALAAAAALGAACGGDDDAAETSGGDGSDDISAVIDTLGGPATFGEVTKGGTLRIANTDFANSDGFDPSGEYFGSAWMIYSTTMLRTLVSTTFTAGDAGEERAGHRDRVAGAPLQRRPHLHVHAQGRDHLRPAGEREVTSQDIKYSFRQSARRAWRPSTFYYNVIEGMEEFAAGDAKHHLRHHDSRRQDHHLQADPAGGRLPLRLAMPATAPIPEEVARRHTQAAEYGRYIVTTGPT